MNLLKKIFSRKKRTNPATKASVRFARAFPDPVLKVETIDNFGPRKYVAPNITTPSALDDSLPAPIAVDLFDLLDAPTQSDSLSSCDSSSSSNSSESPSSSDYSSGSGSSSDY